MPLTPINAVSSTLRIADLIGPKITISSPGTNATIVLPIPFVVKSNLKLFDITDIKLIGQGGELTQSEWQAVIPTATSNIPYIGTYSIKLIDDTKAPIGTQLIITQREYVYFYRTSLTSEWKSAPTTTATLQSYALDSNQVNWRRLEGRDNLNFMWMHRSSRYHLVDPSPTNIVDAFIITKGYYTLLKRWLEDPLAVQPRLPTPLELRTSYGYLLQNKMISDTLVLHPGKIKLLFGQKAAPELRSRFKVIRSADRTLTDNQIKAIMVTAIRNFFNITTWEFGEQFYYTELAAAIHTTLPTEISSVVLVPTMATNHFGDLFQVLAREDEIFYADVSVLDIDIVTGYNSTNLRLNGLIASNVPPVLVPGIPYTQTQSNRTASWLPANLAQLDKSTFTLSNATSGALVQYFNVSRDASGAVVYTDQNVLSLGGYADTSGNLIFDKVSYWPPGATTNEVAVLINGSREYTFDFTHIGVLTPTIQ